MKSFILALLPGLEEETGEFFDKVLGLLDRLSGTVSPSFFLQNIWLVMLTSPSARGILRGLYGHSADISRIIHTTSLRLTSHDKHYSILQ